LCSAWLVKTNLKGEKEWEQTFRGTGFDSACSVQQTDDSGYILAGDTLFETGLCTAWLLKTNSKGEKEWEQTFRGTGFDSASSVRQTSDGGYILAGNTLFETGLCSAWLVKTNSQGDMEWEKTFGITGFDSVSSVQQTTDGGYILAGDTLSSDTGLTAAWLVKTNSKGEKEWEATFGGTGLDFAYAVQQTSDGGYILAGETLSFYIGLCTAWLVKTNSRGIKEWEKTYGESGLDSAYSVQQTTDGGYVFAGETFSLGAYGWTDAWLVKTDSEGNKKWEQTFGGSGDDSASAVQRTADGSYVIAGSTDSYGDGSIDFWLIKVGESAKKVHNINTGEDFATIQEAIDDEDTREGHVITVDPGAKDSKDHVFEVTADYVTIQGFTVEGANVEQKSGIYLDSVDHCTIANNTVTNNYCGIELTSSCNIKLTNNNVTSNNRDGIHLDSSSSNVIRSNSITLNKDDSIHLDSYSSSNVINLNNITFNKFGIFLHLSCNENTIRENNITSNERLGISLATSCNENKILYNEVADNEEDIQIFSSDDNVINNNTVSNGGIGIHLLQKSDDNRVYHNYLQGNTCNGLDDGSGNIWDNGYPSGGNYWSNYDEGIEGAMDVKCGPKQNEDGSDGIVDEPYAIPGDAGTKDNYPLMEPYPTRIITFSGYHWIVKTEKYLFSWDNVPGKDSEKLLRFLVDDHNIGWAKNAEIRKSNDGRTIRIFKDEKSAEIRVHEKKEKASLKISDGRTYELGVKAEKGVLNIYREKIGPGPNYWSDSKKNVWVDEQERLHLRITERDGKWYCAEVYTTEPLGYGEYVFYVTGRVDQMDKNVVLGLFNYLDDKHEIDIEVCKGWEINVDPCDWVAYWGNALFAVKPDIRCVSVNRFNMNLDNSPESEKGKSTHRFTWNSNSIFFKSISGHHYTQPKNSYIIHNWCYTGENIPEPTGLKPHINLWLDKGNQPTDNEEIEIIIDRFEFREKEPWLENPQFIGCVRDTGKKEKEETKVAFEGCTFDGGCWGAHGYTWDKSENVDPIDESQFKFYEEDNGDYNVFLYGKDDQNLDDPDREGGEGYAAVTVIQGNVWRGALPQWHIPEAISIDDKELFIDLWLKKGKSSSYLDWFSGDFNDKKDRVMYAIDVWLMEGDDPNSETAKRMVLDLIFHLGSGDTPWIGYTQPTPTKGWIFHYQPVISNKLEEGEWEFFRLDLGKYLDDAIKAANKHEIAKENNIKYQKENLKLYQAEMLIELRHADAELTIGGFDLYYYPEKAALTLPSSLSSNQLLCDLPSEVIVQF
jgi:parallel beta-helix repeat protein